MRKIIITILTSLSLFTAKAQKVDSIKIYIDSNGNQEIRILANSNMAYTGKWNYKEVSREVDSFLNVQGHFAQANDSLYNFLEIINKAILAEDKLK